MYSQLEDILNRINYNLEYRKEFINGFIKTVKVDDYNIDITIHNNTNITPNAYNELEKSFKDFFNIGKINLVIEVDKIDDTLLEEEYKNIINILKVDKALLEMFESDLIVSERSIKVGSEFNKSLLEEYLPSINSYLIKRGFKELTIIISEEERKLIEEEINNDLDIKVSSVEVKTPVVPAEKKTSFEKPKYEKKEVNEDTIKGRVIKDNPVPIKSIIGEEESVTIEGVVFGTEEFEPASRAFKILTIKITDYTDSIYCKIFSRDDDEFSLLKKSCKAGSWLKIRGSTKIDKYAGNEVVLNIRDINSIPSTEEKIVDKSENKRVELHAHTQMSQMDGISNAKALIKLARGLGHKAVAITDHDGCQSYPDVYHTICDINSSLKEGEEPFKAIYGAELTLIDDAVDIVLRGNDTKLLDNTYVVFDFETTGFNAAGGDSIIEVGAVKLYNGEIIDKFSELIDPKRPLPSKITDVTGITQEMLDGKDDEETVIKRFIEWYGDLPMVAHNAKFDVSFLEIAYSKYNLGEFKNTVIDTLELSRVLDSTYARHSLSALVKRYNVPFDEDSHHRGDYDAEATAYVFHKMMKKVDSNNLETINDMNKLVSKDEIYKYGKSYHVNILVKDKVGLKNLFKIISFANTKYFYKGSARILRSDLDSLREGLLIGSGCYLSEVFQEARSKTDEEMTNIINFYDYVEVQPISCYDHLVQMSDFESPLEVKGHIEKIIRLTKETGKLIVATSDCHHLSEKDKIFREIIVNQKVPGGGRHPLNRSNITDIPSMHFRTTDDMLKDFDFLSEELREEIVITNPNKIADMVEIIEVIIETGGVPFSPKIDKSVETATELVYTKANSMYGDPLPINIEERIAKELYGDAVLYAIRNNLKEEDIED